MTIAAAYLTSEGVVLGTDSTTTVTLNGQVSQFLDHAQKVYEIGDNSRYALCTYGNGKLGDRSHRTVAALVGDAINQQTATLDDVVAELQKIVQAWAASLTKVGSMVGYIVGGIDMPSRTPRCAVLQCDFTTDANGSVTFNISRDDLPIGEWSFHGAPEYFHRILFGYSLNFPPMLREAIKKHHPNCPQDFDTIFKDALSDVGGMFLSVGAGDLPLREAIDFLHTYLQITIKAFKFRWGLMTVCGGPVEIGYISTDRTFRWARHKPFDSAVIENYLSK